MGAGRQTVGFLHGCGLGNATHAPEDRLVPMAALTVLNVFFKKSSWVGEMDHQLRAIAVLLEPQFSSQH